VRSSFASIMYQQLLNDSKNVLLLGDIGVNSHRRAFEDFPDRVFNIGILEQSMVGIAAGLSSEGFRPTIHTIAPFVVERAFEQLKLDLGYQKYTANIVTVGASLDYAALGATHHCPSDVSLIASIPDSYIFVPGHESEFEQLFNFYERVQGLKYFRLSEHGNESGHLAVKTGKASCVKRGNSLTIIAIGPTLDLVLDASKNYDATILYYNSLSPFDFELLLENIESRKLLVVEPYYSGTTAIFLSQITHKNYLKIDYFGIPRQFHTNYGSLNEHYQHFGFTSSKLVERIEALIGNE
jgi:transketolase